MPEPKKTFPETAKKNTDFFLAHRETVESIVVAVILALLFRAFVAEAFVIPTGSMAPTLMGRHVDLECNECHYRYQASASVERFKDDSLTGLRVSDARCPVCGYRKPLDYMASWSNDRSFSGDRIIVSKYSYEFGDPKRWDVIVFKFPEGAQQNYIKRLVGLPGETILIEGGNIYVKSKPDANFEIARKPPIKLLAMLQTIHDSDHTSPKLIKAGWPCRWQSHSESEVWTTSEDQKEFTLVASPEPHWLRYHHFDPSDSAQDIADEPPVSDWGKALIGEQIETGDWQGRLISDFYAYNCARHVNPENRPPEPTFNEPNNSSPSFGLYWVDDLAMECEVDIAQATGDILVDLVRAGTHYSCRIDVKTGIATLSATNKKGEAVAFKDQSKESTNPAAKTSLVGPGKHHIRLSNVDHEVLLWVDGSKIEFDGPTSYESPNLVYPDIESADGDLAPAGVTGVNQALTLRHARIMRDKYYVAAGSDYEYRSLPGGEGRITQILARPTPETLLPLLESRMYREIELGEGQFMPLGDNSPASFDSRYWGQPYVERKLLLGKALFVYWPHSWYQPPFWPDFRRMQPIH